MLSGAVVPSSPAESRAEPEGRLDIGSVPAAIANVRALGIVQRPVLRRDGPGRAVAVGYRESGDQAAGRLHFAEQHVSDCVTAFLPGQADPQHGIHFR